jgi:hypothetical protein
MADSDEEKAKNGGTKAKLAIRADKAAARTPARMPPTKVASTMAG